MATILNSSVFNSAILDLAILNKKTSLIHSDLTWWLQLCWNLPSSIQPFCTKITLFIHSESTWWWHPSWILPSWIQPFCTKKLHSFILTWLDDCSSVEICHPWFRPFCTKITLFIHSESTWWWQPSWNLPSWIQKPCYLLSDSLKNTHPPLWLWLKLIQSD